MNSHLLALIRKYKSKGLLVDTNVALLYLIGSFEPLSIRNHGRTSKYTEDDFTKVSKFIESFPKRITTPHVLTEISNLLGKNEGVNAVFIEYIRGSEEFFLNLGARSLATGTAFPSYGLTDSAIVETARNRYLVITDDGPLYGLLAGSNIDAVNLDQIRVI